MKTIFKAALLAAAPLALAIPVAAQAQAVEGIAVADIQGAVQKSAAFITAMNQMKTTYATQITTFETRSKALQAEIAPLVTAFQTAQKANTPQATLQTQYNAIQQKQQAAQAELQRLSAPIARAQGYVEEQIGAKLDAAIKAAMIAKKVNLVLNPQATISYQPSVDITDAVVAELNRTVPAVGITPPAGWQPGGQGAAAPAPVAPKPTTPTPTPPGR
jgi:Skp family chaperone for outer membrane proteins